MPVSDRILNGAIIPGSSVTNVGLDTVTGSMHAFRQGINIRDFSDLLDYTSFKIRPNSGFITTIDGRDVPENYFDDSISLTNVSGEATASSTTALSTGSISMISLTGAGRISARVSHVREVRDLGQSEYYVDQLFNDMSKPSGEDIVTTHRIQLVVPEKLFDATGLSSMDGVIEPLTIRSLVDRSSPEIPFIAHGIRASFGGVEDPFRRVSEITDEVDIQEIRHPSYGVHHHGASTTWIDAVEHFMTDATGTNSLDLPGVFNIESAKIFPFVESTDQEATVEPLNDVEIKNILAAANYTDDDAKVHEVTAHRGYVFHYGETGYDSIAYGGLKK